MVGTDFKPVWRPSVTDEQLQSLREQNNFSAVETGDFTGRCGCCGSADLWDDNLAYGCNACGALLSTNDAAVMIVKNGAGRA